MPGDLHTHSTFSDGSAPAALVPWLAARAGLNWLALSDHDTLRSVRFAYENPVQHGVRLIPATELTAYDFECGRRVHLLCYWPDLCAELETHCETMARRRNAVCGQSCAELEQIYPQFSAEMARTLAQEGGVLFKAQIMDALCGLGLADGVYRETYRELFGAQGGRVLHDPAYETVETVLATARAARAVVVFAHPSVYGSMPLVRELAAQGKVDGLEIEHPRNTPEDKAELYELARRYDLIVTGGTDFHGRYAGTHRPVGTCTTADGMIARIEALARQRKGDQKEKGSKKEGPDL